jgi:RHS repeat-associated protein
MVANERQPREQLPRPPGPTAPYGAPRSGLNRFGPATPDAQRSDPAADKPRDDFADRVSQDAFVPNLPDVTLPKSGGAIRGLGEKFSVASATGTASLSVPLPVTAARMTPQLRLSYDSGAGNGVFGFGWSLETPVVRRKTDKGLPQYDDVGESDVYILSGSEDLVPILAADGTRRTATRTVFGLEYKIAYYRPRIEGLFARIERWRATVTGLVHWRLISRDNVVTLLGETDDSRVADPANPSRIFEWRISRTFDDKGNLTRYIYDHENGAGLNLAAAHETNRTAAMRNAQIYLRKILYGNRTPYLVDFTAAAAPALPATADFMFAVSLDYGDHLNDGVDPDETWGVRLDPFSIYRAGFEVRTYRRVARLLFFNNFPDDPSVGPNRLVRSLDLTYSDQVNPPDPQGPIYTFLAALRQTGYRDDTLGRHARSLPPLEFYYTKAALDPTVRAIDRESLRDLPEGIDGSRFRWLDLDGEGLPGIICPTPDAWYYKRNLSAANVAERPDKTEWMSPKFAALRAVVRVPGHRDASRHRFLALDGDGMVDVVALTGAETGYYARTSERDFAPFKRFEALPQLDWDDPNLKFIDLTGDGLADVLITEDGLFTFYPSLGSSGFDIAQFVRAPWDEEEGPRIVFADGTDTIFVADMSGDGLNDIVRVRNGETAYWPNLGYGRFGAKVTIDRAPRFDAEDAFDAKRIRLADVDGSGTNDVLYVGRDGVRVWFNQSGNTFSASTLLAVFPAADALHGVQTTDLLGSGTACLVWSSPLPQDAAAPALYVDLMGGVKPHLLSGVRNNLGAESRVTYAPSTRAYLEDEAAGRPWVTRLPFPVWTVERVETIDWIGRNRLVSRYAYHHGFFDGLEREFRGFGMVEQWDTEEFRSDTQFEDDPFANWNALSFTPPVLTRTWFHTGAFVEADKVSRQYEAEYWLEPALRGSPPATGLSAMRPPDSTLPDGMTALETREAYRALKGRALRVEVFNADADGSPIGNPYSVTESNFTVHRLQGRGPNRHASFFVDPRERVALNYERNAGDPRVTHEVTLETNPYGDVVRALSIGYPRRSGPSPEPTLDSATRDRLQYDQGRLHMRGFARSDTNAIDDLVAAPDVYRTPRVAAADLAEITGVAPSDKGFGAASLFAFAELDGPAAAPGIWQTIWSGTHDAPYEQIPNADVDGGGAPAAAPTRRFIARTRTRYRSDDLATLLAVGQIEMLALPGESYSAALTPDHVAAVFGALAPDAVLQEGGYVKQPGETEWWAPSGRSFLSPGDGDTAAQELAYARSHFFLPLRRVDPFGGIARVAYDTNAFLAVSATDAVGNVTSCLNDYRLALPRAVTDPNGNRSEVAFDALGLVVATAVMGKSTENLGDALTGFTIDLGDATIASFFADPLAATTALIGQATSRVVLDIDAYHRTRASAAPAPPAVAVISRETHSADLAVSAYQFAIAYNDGTGRVVQNKTRVAPGPLADGGATVSPRWLGSGWTVFNNKGLPVRRYEPFFTATSAFEFAVQSGVSILAFYDPVGRAVATLHPDASFAKTVFDAWRQKSFDRNDTILIADPRTDADVGAYFRRALGAGPFTSWRDARIGGNFGPDPEAKAAEQDAATKATAHAATPTVAHFDSLGRTCLEVVDNGGGDRFAARSALDTEGKPLAIFDALGRRTQEHVLRIAAPGALTYVAGCDMGGRALYQVNADAGARHSLSDVAGRPLRRWNARGQAFRFVYDVARRMTRRYVSVGGAAEILLELTVYGEGQANANLCGRVFRHYDGAGYIENTRYDFKGNRLAYARQLAAGYRQSPDWSSLAAITDGAALDAAAGAAGQIPTGDNGRDRFACATRYDALNRVIQESSPASAAMHPNVTQQGYDAGGRLTTIDVWLQQAAAPSGPLNPATADRHVVTAIAYNARGQRAVIAHGNGVTVSYAYDPLTFRLTRLTALRPASFATNQQTVQDLLCFYDPVGNITRIRDDADIQNVVFFRNQRVEPSSDYSYDPLYRLIAAQGREHLGQTGGALNAAAQVTDDDSFRMRLLQPGDGNAMGLYRESYSYDALGNILATDHQVASGGWTRRYTYNEASRIVASETGNRLSTTSLPGDPAGGPFSAAYAHDAHGNMINMPHLPTMTWSEDDRLRATSRTVGGANPPTTYYAYDSGGERARKVSQNAAATRAAERIYLDGIEVYREFDAAGSTITLSRETFNVAASEETAARIETRTLGADPGPARQVRYQFANQVHSVTLELGDAAEVISYEEYFPFGATSYQAVASQTDVSKRHRFTGKERDEENGLYCLGARYYAPWLGRWTACDPAGLIDGPNLFCYARNSPAVYRDPEGTDPPAPQPSLQDPPDLPERADDDPKPDDQQAQQQNTGFSNSALVPPLGTYTSEFTLGGAFGFGSPGRSGAGNLLYHFRNVVSPGVELGLQGGFGGASADNPPVIGTGIVAGTLHLGPEYDQFKLDALRQDVRGLYLTAGILWGQNPVATDPFAGRAEQVGGPNPSVSALGVYSHVVSEKQGITEPHLHQTFEFDLNVNAGYQRFGAINGVPVGSLAQLGVIGNVAWNDFPRDNWQTNLELGVTGNVGFGSVIPDPHGQNPIYGSGVGGLPRSVTGTLGVGFSTSIGRNSLGFEPYVQHEAFSNVATQGSTGTFGSGAWVIGLKLDLARFNTPANREP